MFRLVPPLLALAGVARMASAQAAPTALQLNRTGHWDAAVQVADQELRHPGLLPVERCKLLEGRVYSLVMLDEWDAARNTVRMFDAECAQVAINPGFARELHGLRREIGVPAPRTAPRDSV